MRTSRIGPVHRPGADGSPILAAARLILARLAVAPESTPDLKDNLAARCGSMEKVDRGLSHAKHKEWIERDGGKWQLTDAGRAELQAVAA